MDIQKRIEAFWAGEWVDRVPYTIYKSLWQKGGIEDAAWEAMFRDGLGVTFGIRPFRETLSGVECREDSHREVGNLINTSTMRTPLGDLQTVSVNGWRQKYWLETPEDYRIMSWITEHTEVTPAYENYLAEAAALPPHGIPLIRMARTPLQVILVDYAGLEQFSYHLADFEDEVIRLYDARLRLFRRTAELVAAGPGRYVAVAENFSAETVGPARFARFHLPVYQELFPFLRQAGKVVGVHYDGKLASCADLIAQAPIDVVESLTSPPEGDMTLAECRGVWPGRRLWTNINVSSYDLPPQDLREVVHGLVAQVAPDGKRLAVEVSEDLPANWRESMPVVLAALNDGRISA